MNKRNWYEIGNYPLNDLAEYIHNWAKDKGFDIENENESQQIMLMVTELAEAVEAIRHGNPRSKITSTSQVAEELADCIIRILHYCAAKKLNIGEAVIQKMIYNETREYKHGKAF